MTNKKPILLILAMALMLFAQAQPPKNNFQTPDIEQYTLDNGLTVILSEDHGIPEVFGMIVTKAGGKDDPADATGMAHYMEHMFFKGTTKLGTTNWEKEKPHIDKIFALYDELGATTDPDKRKAIQEKINKQSLEANKYAIPNEFDYVVKAMGGTGMNANTSYDRTVFFNSFPPNQVEKWLELYSHRFEDAVFRGFQAELEVVYEEKNLYMDRFQTQMLEEFNKVFYKNHPYGQQTLIGTVDDLKNPSLTKMYDFYKTWYVPNNMALILSGDFDMETVKPMIEERFGDWKRQELPERQVFEEDPFNGREYIEKELSPIKLLLMGYRNPPNGHKDELVMDITSRVLSNSNSTGLLDELTLNNEVMGASYINLQQNDYGAGIFFVVPKIIGQSLEDAEALIAEQINKLKAGEFDDWMVEAIKNELYREWQLAMENPTRWGNRLGEAFQQGRNLEDYLNYPERIQSITKEDVVAMANKYFGDNFLAFYSKRGKPDKTKVEKPGYKPLTQNANARSDYAKMLANMDVVEQEVNYIDFDNELNETQLTQGVKFYYTPNVKNDVYTLTLKFGAGNEKVDQLNYAMQVIDMAGTSEMSPRELKTEFNKLGTRYSIYSNDSYTYVRLTGLESGLKESLKLINKLLDDPQLNEQAIDKVLNGEKTNREVEKSEADNVGSALMQYVLYEDESSFVDRLTLKEIKKLEPEALTDAFKKAQTYEAEVHYAGTTDNKQVQQWVKELITFSEKPKASESPVVKDVEKYKENQVFFVDKSDAVQSKVYFLANGQTYKHEQNPYAEAFNLYFGGGFSGLVLQEIREYRSLAYSAGATYRTPNKEGHESVFIGYVGTQADKTMEAVNTFMDLVRDMPAKTERTAFIKDYLQNSAISAQPGFRYKSTRIAEWKKQGYTEDPLKQQMDVYSQLSFEDIANFYEQHVKQAPVVIAVVGDANRLDMDALKAHGKFTELKEKDIFTD